MRITPPIVAVGIALLIPQLALAQSKSPTEAQCREMINGMVTSMKSAPLDREKDKQGAKTLIERVEKLIRDNRAKGVRECETWASMSKMVTNQ